MKNYEILLIRSGNPPGANKYPGVGCVYVAPQADCVAWARVAYSEMSTVFTAENLRARESREKNEEFALRCLAALERIFVDITKSDVQRAALIINEEAIVTLMAGCGIPRGDPLEFRLKPGEGWLIKMSAYLWQKGKAFEIVGRIGNEETSCS